MKKTKSILTIILLVFIMHGSQLFGIQLTSVSFIDTDTIKSVDGKIEYLLSMSQKFDKLNSSLSFDVIERSNVLITNSENFELIARCNLQKGKLLSKQNEPNKAITVLKEALNYFESVGDERNAGSTLVMIGDAYYQNNQLKKALIYYNSAHLTFGTIVDSLDLVKVYSNIGQVYFSMEKPDAAIDVFNKVIVISNRLGYYYQLSDNLQLLSDLQMKLGIIDSVYSQLYYSLDIAKKRHYFNLESKAYYLLSNYFFVIGNNNEAVAFIEKSIRLSDSVNDSRSKDLEVFIAKLTDNNPKFINYRNEDIYYWLIFILLVISALYFVRKIRLQKSIMKRQIGVINAELEAYKENSNDLTEIINQKTNARIIKIEDEIEENKKEKLALEKSLNELNQVNHLKDVFLSKISREIRTPLSGILGFSEILETELALMEDSTLFEFAVGISQSGQGLVSLLNNLLDISKLDSNSMTVEFNRLITNELVQSVVDSYYPLASLKGVKLIYSADDVHEIHTDGQLFTKIISVILDNSIKFTEKGFIKVSHHHDEKSNTIYITIKDTGIGIDKVYIDQVFEPFRQESLGYSTSYQGAGLGLPLAKKMSFKLNGDIKIESEKGSGTTITLAFPAYTDDQTLKVDEKESIPEKNIELPEFPWNDLSVLVVEDDRMNQILYRKLLKSVGYLEIAKDGKSALSIIEKQTAERKYFQLVLMDINLPTPWDGVSLMHEIRKRWSQYEKIPFIAQTAYAISGNREAMMTEGFDEYITKPIIKSILIDVISKVF